jgi:hypothetical protein
LAKYRLITDSTERTANELNLEALGERLFLDNHEVSTYIGRDSAEEPSLDTDILSYGMGKRERSLLTLKDMINLPQHKLNTEYVMRVLGNKIAHFRSLEFWRSLPGSITRVYGEEFAQNEQYNVLLGDCLSLKLRRGHALILLYAGRKPDGSLKAPDPILRLDTLFDHKSPGRAPKRHRLVAVKSALETPDEERINTIAQGVTHLQRLISGADTYTFTLYASPDILFGGKKPILSNLTSPISELHDRLRGRTGTEVFLGTFNESQEELADAANYALAQYAELAAKGLRIADLRTLAKHSKK